jgi:hypothetical protein
VKFIKTLSVKSKEDYDEQKAELLRKLLSAKKEGRIIINVDECMFTTSTKLRLAYSQLGTNIAVNDRMRNQEAIAVVGGVSEGNGVEAYILKPDQLRLKVSLSLLTKFWLL